MGYPESFKWGTDNALQGGRLQFTVDYTGDRRDKICIL